MKLLATETETCVIDRATLIALTEVSLLCTFPPEKTWNHGGPVLVCPQGTTSNFPRNHNVPPAKHTRQQYMGLLTEFKKEMQQTELHSCHLVHVEVPVNSFLLKRNTAQLIWVSKLPQHHQTREKPYHKTIPVILASRLLQIGDNQGPNANDVGNDVDQM